MASRRGRGKGKRRNGSPHLSAKRGNEGVVGNLFDNTADAREHTTDGRTVPEPAVCRGAPGPAKSLRDVTFTKKWRDEISSKRHASFGGRSKFDAAAPAAWRATMPRSDADDRGSASYTIGGVARYVRKRRSGWPNKRPTSVHPRRLG